MGKLSTAIKMWLLLAFAAMPDRSVKEAAKPIEASPMVRQNKAKSAIGFLRSMVNRRKPVKDKITVSRKL